MTPSLFDMYRPQFSVSGTSLSALDEKAMKIALLAVNHPSEWAISQRAEFVDNKHKCFISKKNTYVTYFQF